MLFMTLEGRPVALAGCQRCGEILDGCSLRPMPARAR
jgi:hypothetical protein